jgi:hypothetical protein
MLTKNAITAPFTHPDRYTRGTDAAMYTTLGLPAPATAGEIVSAINDELAESNKAACKRMFGWFERIAAEVEAQS